MIEFAFENTRGQPSIRVHASPSNGANLSDWSGNAHVRDSAVVDAIIAQSNAGSHAAELAFRDVTAQSPASVLASDLLMATGDWRVVDLGDDQHFLPLMFEALTEGQGDLVVSLKNNAGEVLSSSRVSLDLRDVQAFYEHWSVGTNTTTQYSSIPSTASKSSPTRPTTELSRDEFTDEYLMFVHGWNMEPEARLLFAETAYKRSWWNGFEGRFGLYSWPTDVTYSSADGTILGYWIGVIRNAGDIDNFNRSEQRAYYSAEGLRNLLSSLQNGQYSGNVNVLAHSMGGTVASEAMRREAVLDPTPQTLVQNLVLTQVAYSADAYDPTVADMNDWSYLGLNAGPPPHTDLYGLFPDDGPLPDQPYYQPIHDVTGTVYNYYNPDDYALDLWDWNQNGKHRLGSGYSYAFAGDGRTFNTPSGEQTLGSSEAANYELLAYAVRSHSRAIGTQPVLGIIGRHLFNVSGFTRFAHEHSGQFNQSLLENWNYW